MSIRRACGKCNGDVGVWPKCPTCYPITADVVIQQDGVDLAVYAFDKVLSTSITLPMRDDELATLLGPARLTPRVKEDPTLTIVAKEVSVVAT